ncbi:MAG: OmpA family protein, partial [Oligoflexales bacterium]|nr:OmpA family protein [Oligoflexales bacterium]
MKNRTCYLCLISVFSFSFLFTACVSSSTHEKVVAELKAEKDKNALLSQQLNLKSEEVSSQTKELTNKKAEIDAKTKEMGALSSSFQQREEELLKLRQAAAARDNEMKSLTSKLQKMIDAGSLTVTIRKGRMIVSLPSDILFPVGSTKISSEGQKALVTLSETLKSIKDRTFLIVGHSDPTPISGPKYSSNWDLSAGRAVSVVTLLVREGVN